MERRTVTVQGIVQGVGFRPFVYHLAARWRLMGFVKNVAGAVHIEVEGEPVDLDQFIDTMATQPPPLAQIASLSWTPALPQGDRSFRIDASESTDETAVFFAPDVATCDACLAELFDPSDRRFHYPFLSCAHCGPRLTIVTGAPYDRARTTMASFPLCAACRAEYDDPANRRFHAQPVACPACGPRLSLRDARGRILDTETPLATFAEALRLGRIGALKGLGGYHLVVNASDEPAVARLRQRKHRDEKPFAVMVRDVHAAMALVEITPRERTLLESPRRPIVLLKRRAGDAVAPSVAPRHPRLGILLPYTPLHHLLLHAVSGPLVMTSGNRSDEPIAYDDADALARLADIADVFLTHDRPIRVRCDDSVTRVVGNEEAPVRRSRGYAPQPVELPVECPCPILAVGGQLKGAFALGRGRHAFLSHHLGDLDHAAAYRAFTQDVALYQELFEVRPEATAHDLHPDYQSTRYARGLAEPIRRIAVQHHHAHLASCLAENGSTGPAIGVIFDGAGYGLDGAIWGGEFLVGDLDGFWRGGHLRYVGLPGGDQAVRQPWRSAAAYLWDAGCDAAIFWSRQSPNARRTIETMLARGVQTPPTSSVGRLFDAVAALAGVRDSVAYEGQAAIEFEWLAEAAETSETADHYPFDLVRSEQSQRRLSNGCDERGSQNEAPLLVDTRPLIRAVVDDVHRQTAATRVARRFHSTMVEVIAAVCARLRAKTGLDVVALSGGVFMNAILTAEVSRRLHADGFRVLRHRLAPTNDGGLCLGQLAIAAASLRAQGRRSALEPQ
jgi:hydrogenase maturation protein HypF